MMKVAVEGFKGALEISPSPLAGGAMIGIRGSRGAVLLDAQQIARAVAALVALAAAAPVAE